MNKSIKFKVLNNCGCKKKKKEKKKKKNFK